MTTPQRCELFQAVCMVAAATWYFATGGSMNSGAWWLLAASLLPALLKWPEIRRRVRSLDRPASWRLWVCGLGLVSCLICMDIAMQHSRAMQHHLMDVVMAVAGATSLVSLAKFLPTFRATGRT